MPEKSRRVIGQPFMPERRQKKPRSRRNHLCHGGSIKAGHRHRSFRQPPATRIRDEPLIAGKGAQRRERAKAARPAFRRQASRPTDDTQPLQAASPPQRPLQARAQSARHRQPATPKAPSRKRLTQDRPRAKPQADSARHRTPPDRRCSAPTKAADRPAPGATPPATASSVPDVPHPAPRSCSAPLPCTTALSPRRIRLSPPALPPRQIPPGGHHREAGEALGIRVGSTQPTSEFGAGGALPDLTEDGRGNRRGTNGYAHADRKARISAPTKDAVKPEREPPSQTEEGTSARYTGSTCKSQRKNSLARSLEQEV